MLDGLSAGEQIVVEGSLKVRAGSEVRTVEMARNSETGAMVTVTAANNASPEGN